MVCHRDLSSGRKPVLSPLWESVKVPVWAQRGFRSIRTQGQLLDRCSRLHEERGGELLPSAFLEQTDGVGPFLGSRRASRDGNRVPVTCTVTYLLTRGVRIVALLHCGKNRSLRRINSEN